MNRTEFYLSLLAIIILQVLGFNYLHEEFNDVIEASKRLDMYNKSLDWPGTNGVYNWDSHYCVWTKGRSDRDINSTETHEQCHNLVYQDPIHYCEKHNEC
jgi:hypothetical protein